MTAIVWFRRDLRVHDHPALHAALESAETVVPVFCFDDALLRGRHASGPRTQFLLECLGELDAQLRDRGSQLIVRRGTPERELPALAESVGAGAVHLSADAGPFARRRQREVRQALGSRVQFCVHPGLFVVDRLDAIRTRDGGAYTVFTPFERNWSTQPRREVLAAPRGLPALPSGVDVGTLPTLADLGLAQECAEPARGGEGPGREVLARFLAGPVRGYDEGRDGLAGDEVSRLSPYLHFGCVSPREAEDRLPGGTGGAAYRRQLCWRDFYAHVLGHFPGNAHSEFQERYRGGAIRWSRARRRFEAWCEGRTGYPVVDAGMRQLRREGWMHNRARLVVGSFLTKDLGIDWRWGERWFMRLLLDGDEASNNGNWQWIASVGVDPQPAFRRIFNPSRQQGRFDPDGAYVRRYVPELERVPDAYLCEPWTMPSDVQERACCRIGREYPEPIVDHARARQEALDRYRV